jgi:two-component system sensor histidine kinase DegS
MHTDESRAIPWFETLVKHPPTDLGVLSAPGQAFGRPKGALKDYLNDFQDELQTRRLLEATIKGQEEERERICLDLHDGVCQTLATAFQYLETIDLEPGARPEQWQQLQRARALVRLGIRQAREIVASLRPARLDALGLVAALQHDLRDLNEQTGIEMALVADAMVLPNSIQTALYRIIHEALNNVIKHAGATRVTVSLHMQHGNLVVVVHDNGIGFAPGRYAPRPDTGGIGLTSMRRRTELLNGHFEIVSRPGDGCRVCITLPSYAMIEPARSA